MIPPNQDFSSAEAECRNSLINEVLSGYKLRLIESLESLNKTELENFIGLLLSTIKLGGTIYFQGNGGSSATCSHFVNDLSLLSEKSSIPIYCKSLCTDSSILTCLANDFSFEDVFLRQIKSVLRSNDLLVSLSASGNSENLVRSVRAANEKGVRTVSILGFDGGILKDLSTDALLIPSAVGDYGVVEDLHLSINHITMEYLRREFL